MSKILICEKNEFFRDSLKQIIQTRFPQVDVRLVLNFDDCLVQVYDFKPDILILGINSYTGHGLDKLDRIRRVSPGLNVILFTDYDIDEYRKEAIMRGANHIITKEFWTGGEILALLRTILLTTSASMVNFNPENTGEENKSLKRPLERRRKDSRGRATEQEYLAQHPDRREINKKSGLFCQ